MEYTKGEWKIGSKTLTEIYIQTDEKVVATTKTKVGKSGTVAKVKSPFGTQADDIEAGANANLIASAPDLYEALTQIIEHLRKEDATRKFLLMRDYDVLNIGSLALNKAEEK